MPIRWTSSATFLEYPLVSVAIGPDPSKKELRGHARAIIAIGDIATGVIALGGVACGAVALGGLAMGGIVLGGCGIGLLALAGLALGYLAMGGVAIGYAAIGGLAVGYYAMGGVVFNLVVGAMLDAGFGYGPVFGIVSTLHVAAFAVILATVPRKVFP